MTTHQAIWYDHDGYILNQQAGSATIYEQVTLNGDTINNETTITPTGQNNLPEGWPIYRLKHSTATIAINPQSQEGTP
jgi:hypothetical protein